VPKVKKKRLGTHIDMTPLVDITFLLLTFFMFTAKFKSQAESEQKFTIKRPESSADTSKVPETNLAVIRIGIDSVTADTSYYYSISNETDREQVWSAVESIPPEMYDKHLLKVDYSILEQLIKQNMLVNPQTRFAIDADKRLRFKWIKDAMEALRKNRATVFNYVTMKKGGGL